MGVVFDEVIANVDAPTTSHESDDNPQQALQKHDEHEVIQIMEAERRHLLRLQAD